MGYPHPDFLLKQLTSGQFAEWEAYSIIEPFGAMHKDEIISIQTAALANTGMAEKKDKSAFKPDDFFIRPEDIIIKKDARKYQDKDQAIESARMMLMGLTEEGRKKE